MSKEVNKILKDIFTKSATFLKKELYEKIVFNIY